MYKKYVLYKNIPYEKMYFKNSIWKSVYKKEHKNRLNKKYKKSVKT